MCGQVNSKSAVLCDDNFGRRQMDVLADESRHSGGVTIATVWRRQSDVLFTHTHKRLPTSTVHVATAAAVVSLTGKK